MVKGKPRDAELERAIEREAFLSGHYYLLLQASARGMVFRKELGEMQVVSSR